MDLHRPFRHDEAISRGVLARHQLTDGSFTPLFPGVSVREGTTVTAALRATGAALAYPGAVVAGLDEQADRPGVIGAAVLDGIRHRLVDREHDLVGGPLVETHGQRGALHVSAGDHQLGGDRW